MPPRVVHSLAAFATALLTILVSNNAFAWVETTVLAAESRVELHRDASAHIQHKVTFRVQGGPLRSLDLSVSDRQIAVSGDASLAPAADSMTPQMPVPVTVEQQPDGDVRVDIDEKRGVHRGVYTLVFGYDVDLLQAGGITRDGSMLSVTWMGPKWPDGIDNVKCVIAVPASPTAPRSAYDPHGPEAGSEMGAGPVGSYLTTITRLPEFDEVALIRPHVARDEVVPWSVRIDPSAVGDVNDPRLRAPVSTSSAVALPPRHRAVLLGLAALVAIAFSIVLALKHRQVSAASSARGVAPRPLVPFGIAARVALAGPLLGAGLAAQAWLTDPNPGSIAVLAVVALTVYLAPSARHTPRGPGRWLPLTDADAFRVEKGKDPAWLDVSTTSGKVVWALVTLAYGGAVAAIGTVSFYHAHVAALDYVVIAALFWTGRKTQLPADPVRSAAPILRQIASQLRKSKAMEDTRIRAIGRLPTGAASPDELRLSIRPRHSLRGLQAIELGIAWAHGAGGSTPLFQALVRVVEDSACHDALTPRVPAARWLRGRESYERVLSVAPPLPTLEHAIRLLEALSNATCEQAPAPSQATVRRRAPKPRQPRASAPSNARKLCGTSSRTSNAGTDALPLHTTW